MNTQNTQCWTSCIGFFILWWLIASALLMVTWNKVIGTVARVKNVKFWHTLVLILTVSFICVIPKLCMSRYYGKGGCAMHSSSQCMKGGACAKSDCSKGDCEHQGKKGAKYAE